MTRQTTPADAAAATPALDDAQLQAGASDYLLKHALTAELLQLRLYHAVAQAVLQRQMETLQTQQRHSEAQMRFAWATMAACAMYFARTSPRTKLLCGVTVSATMPRPQR